MVRAEAQRYFRSMLRMLQEHETSKALYNVFKLFLEYCIRTIKNISGNFHIGPIDWIKKIENEISFALSNEYAYSI